MTIPRLTPEERAALNEPADSWPMEQRRSSILLCALSAADEDHAKALAYNAALHARIERAEARVERLSETLRQLRKWPGFPGEVARAALSGLREEA